MAKPDLNKWIQVNWGEELTAPFLDSTQRWENLVIMIKHTSSRIMVTFIHFLKSDMLKDNHVKYLLNIIINISWMINGLALTG